MIVEIIINHEYEASIEFVDDDDIKKLSNLKKSKDYEVKEVMEILLNEKTLKQLSDSHLLNEFKVKVKNVKYHTDNEISKMSMIMWSETVYDEQYVSEIIQLFRDDQWTIED